MNTPLYFATKEEKKPCMTLSSSPPLPLYASLAELTSTRFSTFLPLPLPFLPFLHLLFLRLSTPSGEVPWFAVRPFFSFSGSLFHPPGGGGGERGRHKSGRALILSSPG